MLLKSSMSLINVKHFLESLNAILASSTTVELAMGNCLFPKECTCSSFRACVYTFLRPWALHLSLHAQTVQHRELADRRWQCKGQTLITVSFCRDGKGSLLESHAGASHGSFSARTEALLATNWIRVGWSCCHGSSPHAHAHHYASHWLPLLSPS